MDVLLRSGFGILGLLVSLSMSGCFHQSTSKNRKPLDVFTGLTVNGGGSGSSGLPGGFGNPTGGGGGDDGDEDGGGGDDEAEAGAGGGGAPTIVSMNVFHNELVQSAGAQTMNFTYEPGFGGVLTSQLYFGLQPMNDACVLDLTCVGGLSSFTVVDSSELTYMVPPSFLEAGVTVYFFMTAVNLTGTQFAFSGVEQIQFSLPSQSETIRILTVGNSHTNSAQTIDVDVWEIIGNISQSENSEVLIQVDDASHGGYFLESHLNFGEAPDMIESGNYDYVVLQDNGRVGRASQCGAPATPGCDFGIVKQAAKELYKLIANSGAIPVWYQVWNSRESMADEPGDPYYNDPHYFWFRNYESTTIYGRHNSESLPELALQQFGGQLLNQPDVILAPTDRVFERALRLADDEGLNIPLADGDASTHANPNGKLAAAYTIYSVITGKDVIGFNRGGTEYQAGNPAFQGCFGSSGSPDGWCGVKQENAEWLQRLIRDFLLATQKHDELFEGNWTLSLENKRNEDFITSPDLRIGEALDHEGSANQATELFASQENYIIIPYQIETNPENQLSAMLYGQLLSPTGKQHLLSKGDQWGIYAEDGKIKAYVKAESSTVEVAHSVDLMQWHHYAITYDGASIKLFVDGQIVQNQAQSGNIDYSGSVPFQSTSMELGKFQSISIGVQNSLPYPEFEGQNFMTGRVSDVEFFPYALTESQIQSKI